MKKLLFIGIITLCSSNVYAETWCTGKITELGINRHGIVYASGPENMPATYLCSVQNKENNFEVEACKAVYSTLLAAKIQDKEVNITFNPNITSCQELPSWKYAENFNWVITK